jgi:hypothetical protein
LCDRQIKERDCTQQHDDERENVGKDWTLDEEFREHESCAF